MINIGFERKLVWSRNIQRQILSKKISFKLSLLEIWVSLDQITISWAHSVSAEFLSSPLTQRMWYWKLVKSILFSLQCITSIRYSEAKTKNLALSHCLKSTPLNIYLIAIVIRLKNQRSFSITAKSGVWSCTYHYDTYF